MLILSRVILLGSSIWCKLFKSLQMILLKRVQQVDWFDHYWLNILYTVIPKKGKKYVSKITLVLHIFLHKKYDLFSDLNARLCFLGYDLSLWISQNLQCCQILLDIIILLRSIYLWNLAAIQFVDFEISKEKGDFLKTTVGHLALNRSNIIDRFYYKELENSHSINFRQNTHKKFFFRVFLRFQ